MRKPQTAHLAVACIAATLAGNVFPACGQEPSSDGRTLRQWVEILGSQNGTPEYFNAQKAIREFGTNAIPSLLYWIAYDPLPTSPERRYFATYGNASLFALAQDAVDAFRILGPIATPALPGLSNIVALSRPFGCGPRAIEAMGYIRPAGLPQLITILTNGAPYNRGAAALTLGSFGTNARPAVPALILSLTNSASRQSALKTLAYLAVYDGVEYQLIFTAITNLTRDPDPTARGSAIQILSGFGKEARQALPQLLAALDDPDKGVRSSATNTIKDIAPDVVLEPPLPWPIVPTAK